MMNKKGVTALYIPLAGMKKHLGGLTMKLDREKLMTLLVHNTPSGNETLTRDFVLEELKRLGFTAQTDDYGNVYGVRGKADKYPLLNAHMDIVELGWGFGYSRKTAQKRMEEAYGWKTYSWEKEPTPLEAELPEDLGAGELNTLLHLANDYVEQALDIIKDEEILNFEDLDYLAELFELKQNLESLLSYMESTDVTTAEQGKECLEAIAQTIWDVDRDLYYSLYDELDVLEEQEAEEEAEEAYTVTYNEATGIIKGSGGRVLGGDDKCGIFIALSVLEALPKLPAKVLFTVEEEIGCIGVDKFVMTNLDFLSDVAYSITIDRKGFTDLLYKQCGKRSCTWEFAGKLAYHGIRNGIPVTMNDGNVADVITLRDLVPNAVNMSAGYYDAHSEREYVDYQEVEQIALWVRDILQDKSLLHLKGYKPYTKTIDLGKGKKNAKEKVKLPKARS